MRWPWLMVAPAFTGHVGLARFVMPHSLEDGEYTVTLPGPGEDQAAEPVLRKRSSDEEAWWKPKEPEQPPRFEPGKYRPYTPVPISNLVCRFDQPPMEAEQYMDAREGLRAYCELFLLPPRTIQLSVNNSHGVYMCNYSLRPQACFMAEYDWVESMVLDEQCGSQQPGHVEAGHWAKWFGRAWPGDMLCPFNFRWLDIKPHFKPEHYRIHKQIYDAAVEGRRRWDADTDTDNPTWQVAVARRLKEWRERGRSIREPGATHDAEGLRRPAPVPANKAGSPGGPEEGGDAGGQPGRPTRGRAGPTGTVPGARPPGPTRAPAPEAGHDDGTCDDHGAEEVRGCHQHQDQRVHVSVSN